MVRLWDEGGSVRRAFKASGSSQIVCGARSSTADMVVIGSQELKLWNVYDCGRDHGLT